jgi:hypothetical protein
MIKGNDYWMSNKEWYERYIDDGIPCVRLTDKAPQKAVDSFNEYFKEKDKQLRIY